MKKTLMSKAWLALLLLTAISLVAACTMPSTVPLPEQSEEVAPSAGEGELVTLYVGPNREPCMGVAPMECLMVKEDPNGEYQFFHSQIEGFEFEPGYTYELLVNKTTVPNPPADASSLQWTLVEVVSKTPTTTTATLEGTTWQLIAYLDQSGNLTMTLPEAPATLLLQEGQASGNTGCNSFFGAYTLDGEALTITPMGSTMMACPDPQMTQEQAYLAALSSVASYAIVGNQLQLADAEGVAVLAFEPQVQTSLTGTVWSATMVNNGLQAVVSLVAGSQITATFGDDGTLSGTAGCNSYSTGYTLDGANISIGPAASTRMFCGEPEGVMEQEAAYLAALETAATYSISGDSLELRTADGALAVSFVATAPESAEAAPETGDETKAPVPVDEATMQAMGNMTYFNIAVTPTVTLTNGIYTETLSSDGSSGIMVELTDTATMGELDGQVSYAAVLASNGGGSGVFSDLAVVQDQDGQLVNVATTTLGDRVTVNSLEIVDNRIVVDMITQGPDEPMCCGTLNVKNVYALEDGELVLESTVEVASSEAAAPAASIVGVVWEWVETAYGDDSVTTVADPSQYTLLLNEDGTATLQVDCNRGGGSYSLDDSRLSLNVFVMTRVACPDGSLSDEFLSNLNAAATYVMDGDDLVINMFADSGNVRFQTSAAETESAATGEAASTGQVVPETTQPAAAADIMDVTWQWVGFTDPVSGTQEIADPANYTLKLNPSGSISVQADCNRGGGSYAIDGSTIAIDITFMTLAACPEGSMSDLFVQRLNAAATWFVDGENLYIDLFADSGTMKFAKAS